MNKVDVGKSDPMAFEKLAKQARLRLVTLISSKAERKDSPSDQTGVLFARENVRWRTSETEKDGAVLWVRPRLTAKGVGRGGSKESIPFEMSAEYELVYQLPAGASQDKELVASFAMFNGTFNVWPFWRELAQSFFMRMGIYGITVPLYMAEKPPKEEGDVVKL